MPREPEPEIPTCLLKIRVQPNAKKSEIAEILPDGTVRIRLAAPPVEGKANEALAAFLAKALGIRKGAVRLARGEKSRDKLWEISGLNIGDALKRLQPPNI